MRITDVTVTMFEWTDIPPVPYGEHNPTTQQSSCLGLVSVETEGGLVGHSILGSSYRSARIDVQGLIEVLKPVVVGRNALDRESIYADLMVRTKAVSWRTVGAIDIALWDLAGKVAGLPIHQLLGTYRHSVPAYASSSTLSGVDAYVEQVSAIKAKGYAGYKIHPPRDTSEHIEVCREVRRTVGDDYPLMLDAAMAYSFPQAVRVGRAIEELDFYWYEDPLAEDDLHNNARLCRKLDVPILATEYTPGGYRSLSPWITSGATDFLRGDVAVKGGITGLMRIAHLADAFHMTVEIHHGGNSVNNFANLHVALAIGNCDFFEVLMPAEVQKYAVTNDLEIDGSGHIHAPDGPGLGADLDFDLISDKTVAVLR